MALPELLGRTRYNGATSWDSSITVPSSFGDGFPSGCRILVCAFAWYATETALGTLISFHDESLPGSWTSLGRGAASLTSGFTNDAFVAQHVYSARNTPSLASLVLTPLEADESPFTPTTGALKWFALATAWSPSFSHGAIATGNQWAAGESSSVVPATGVTPLAGNIEGTWIQFTGVYIDGFAGTFPGISTANDWTDHSVDADYRLASKEFTGTGSTDPILYSKNTGSFQIGSAHGSALDIRDPGLAVGHHLGLSRGGVRSG